MQGKQIKGRKIIIDIKEIIDRVMENKAGKSWEIIREEIIIGKGDLERIIEGFEEKYWGTEIQEGVKNRMEVERYKGDGSLSRTENFIEKIIILKNLTPPLTEEEIIKRLSRNFNKNIQNAKYKQNKRFREIFKCGGHRGETQQTKKARSNE